MALQHLRSSTANKRPIPTVMSSGQIAININEASPGLFFKDSNGDLVKVGPVHIGTDAPNSSPASTAATALVAGTTYQILTVGTTDFTLVGASANTVGVIFTATGVGTGTGTVSGQQGVEKGEQWLDTTGGAYDLKIYDGTSWRSQAGEFVNVTGDTMTGALLLDNAASAALPDLSFDGDADTGIYSPAADGFGIATAGTAAVTVDASQNVGIGTTSPGRGPLHVHESTAASNAYIKLSNVSTGALASDGTDLITLTTGDFYINNRETADIAFLTAAQERMRIDSAGNVGIGTTSPSYELDVRSSDTTTVNINAGTTNLSRLFFSDTTVARGYFNYSHSDDSLAIGTASDERMLIDSSGKVGIGVTSPVRTLHLNEDTSSACLMSFTNTTTGAGSGDGMQVGIDNAENARVWQLENGNLDFGTNNTQRMRIDSAGRVGIGLSNPGDYSSVSKDLVVGNHDGARGITIAAQSNNTGYLTWADGTSTTAAQRAGRISYSHPTDSMRFDTAATELMRIDSSGRLLVGTSSSSSSSIAVFQGFAGDSTGPGIAYFQRGQTAPTSNAEIGQIFFANSSGNIGSAISAIADANWTAGSSHPTRLVFSTTGSGASSPTERMRIDKNGNITNCLGIYNNTTAAAANVFVGSAGDLGRSTSSAKYKTDIEAIEESYSDALLNCRPVWYRSLCSSDNPDYGYWGFIAEEVAEVDPRLVHWKTSEPVKQEDGSIEHVSCEPEPEGVAYDRFVPHLLNLIKRQQQAIETLEAKVAALEAG